MTDCEFLQMHWPVFIAPNWYFLISAPNTSAPLKHLPLITHSAYIKIDCPIYKIEVIKINKASRINLRYCLGGCIVYRRWCRNGLRKVRGLCRFACCNAIQDMVELARYSLLGFEAKYMIGLARTGDAFELRHQDRKISNEIRGLDTGGKFCSSWWIDTRIQCSRENCSTWQTIWENLVPLERASMVRQHQSGAHTIPGRSRGEKDPRQFDIFITVSSMFADTSSNSGWGAMLLSPLPTNR